MEYVKIKEIAKIYDVNDKTIRNWIKFKKMPCIKIGNTLRFQIDKVEKWIKEEN